MNNTISVTGHLCVDYIIAVDEYPPIGQSRQISSREKYFGGGAANIAVGIAKLGGEAELISSVGRDFKESGYGERLKSLGVKTHFFESEKNCSTAFMVNNAKGDQITYFEWGAGEAFARSNPPARDFVHMATGDPEFNIKVAKQAKFASLDPGQDVKYYSAEHLTELFENIDLLMCNNFEIGVMCSTLNCSEDELLEKVDKAIITKGKDGSTLYSDGKITEIPSVSVTAVDPTGAGDAYRAGFFTSLKKGYSEEISCKMGAVVSSFAVEKVGTQTNLPDWETASARYRKIFGDIE
ncbi:MAG: carbohydrate kinase family protein [Methanocorpusculum sp.]|nr:carbohydrate kinase family protein [Methanocorpusculum sp.]